MAFSDQTPYITPVELINAPLGVDWNSLPTRGSTSPNAEQLQLCWRVTDRMDQLAEQTLRAAVVVQNERGPDFTLTVDRWTMEGRLRTPQWPILQVLSGQWSWSSVYPPAWTPIASNQFLIDDLTGYLHSPFPKAARGQQYINIAPGVVDWSRGRNAVRLQTTYVAGVLINSGISAGTAGADGSRPNGALVGDTHIHVDDICGWGVLSGTSGRLYDGNSTEGILVTAFASDTGLSSGPGVLTLASALTSAHPLGTRVAHQPSELQQAAFCLAVAYARIRGAAAIAPQARGAPITSHKSVEELFVEAEEILGFYKPIIV